ncbi:hypothetical protein MKZ20_20105 [Psychrobacillus sp. FSL K6-2684]|uniref:hypothetical protein n=1 Tax=Psychrobacillus sp. FSL K6-2684 TaxID=2921547 RepID=UPI0030F6615F
MQTRGKSINGMATLVNLTPIVILNETSKSGMLRLLGFQNLNPFVMVKIEVDGEIYFYGSQVNLMQSTNSSVPLGMAIYISNNSTPQVDPYRKIFNIPFTNSLKITLVHNPTTPQTNVYYGAEYAIDV